MTSKTNPPPSKPLPVSGPHVLMIVLAGLVLMVCGATLVARDGTSVQHGVWLLGGGAVLIAAPRLIPSLLHRLTEWWTKRA